MMVRYKKEKPMVEYEKIRLNVYSYEAINAIMNAFHSISIPKIPFVDPYERPLFEDTYLRNYVGVDETGEYYFLVEWEHHYDINLVKQICQLHLTYMQGQYKGTTDKWWTLNKMSAASPSGAMAPNIDETNAANIAKLQHVLNHWAGIGTPEDESFVGAPFDPFKSAIFKEKLDRFKEITDYFSDPHDPAEEKPLYGLKDFEQCKCEILATLGVPNTQHIYMSKIKPENKGNWMTKVFSFFN